ncbi:hypothetical protein PEC301899_33650 [Pectobacterium carotovorum subsp. carotovorum]|nr:hypothetical protein PEC301899_33650 [Pectobacterium carotovorum subsp. carotovorum]
MKVEQTPISLIKNASSVIGISDAILIHFLKQCEDIRVDTTARVVKRRAGDSCIVYQ